MTQQAVDAGALPLLCAVLGSEVSTPGGVGLTCSHRGILSRQADSNDQLIDAVFAFAYALEGTQSQIQAVSEFRGGARGLSM